MPRSAPPIRGSSGATSGKDFEARLLHSQLDALQQEMHIAGVMAELETAEAHRSFSEQARDRCDALHTEAERRLQRGNACKQRDHRVVPMKLWLERGGILHSRGMVIEGPSGICEPSMHDALRAAPPWLKFGASFWSCRFSIGRKLSLSR